MSLLIGIAGGTGAGKTAITRELVKRFTGCLLDIDSYYVDPDSIRLEVDSIRNYDEPASIDADLLVGHVRSLLQGESVQKPIYLFDTHRRVGMETVSPAEVIIVEGLFTFCYQQLLSLFDLKVFVDAPADLRLLRRLDRDLVERGRTVAHVLQQYISTVRPMHYLHVEPTRIDADLVVLNDDGSAGACVDAIAAAIGELGRCPRGIQRPAVDPTDGRCQVSKRRPET